MQLAASDEFVVTLDEMTDWVAIVDGENVIRLSMPLADWKKLVQDSLYYLPDHLQD